VIHPLDPGGSNGETQILGPLDPENMGPKSRDSGDLRSIFFFTRARARIQGLSGEGVRPQGGGPGDPSLEALYIPPIGVW